MFSKKYLLLHPVRQQQQIKMTIQNIYFLPPIRGIDNVFCLKWAVLRITTVCKYVCDFITAKIAKKMA